jgi:glycerol uptake facilitator-like aquaporin
MADRVTAPRRRGYREGIGGEMLAEFLGTFVLILLGIGSVAVALVGLPGSARRTGSSSAGAGASASSSASTSRAASAAPTSTRR